MPDAPLPADSKPPKGVTTTYTVPESARALAGDPRTLTYAMISLDMELDAGKVADSMGGGTNRLAIELTKRSVVAVDGKPVSWEGTDPDWFDRASPKVRELALRGFARVNRSSLKEDSDFLASEVVGSG